MPYLLLNNDYYDRSVNAVVEFNKIHGQQNCQKISIMPV